MKLKAIVSLRIAIDATGHKFATASAGEVFDCPREEVAAALIRAGDAEKIAKPKPKPANKAIKAAPQNKKKAGSK